MPRAKPSSGSSRGRTTKPVSLMVHESLASLPEMTALEAAGHCITAMPNDWERTLILGPNAWRMTVENVANLKLAMAAAKKLAYPSIVKAGGEVEE